MKSDNPIELDESYDPVFFKNTPLKEEGTLYVPKGSKEAYLNADVWKDFPNIIEYEGEWQEPIQAEEISLNKSNLTLLIGESAELTATVSPDNATEKNVTWNSSDASVATVDVNGKVTAIAVGTATITATCGEVSATCTVTISPQEGDINGDGQFTISDITYTASQIMGTLGDGNEFYAEAADMDKDGKVLVNDLTAIIDLVLEADNAAYAPTRAPQKECSEEVSVFDLSEVQTADNVVAIDVSVKPGYIAAQFDVILPEGSSLTKASLVGDNAQTHKLTCRKKDGNRVRIIIFSMDNAEMADNLVRLTLQYNGEGEIQLTNALVNEMLSDGRITESAAASTRTKITGNATAIKSTADSMKIYAEAGAVVIESSKAQTITITNAAGIARKVNVGIGTTRIALLAGVYVVNNVKLLIQ